MGIAVNLVTYLGGVMHLPSSTSANIVTDFMGTCFLLCLLGGFLADSFLGRYKTIGIFAVVQTLVSLIIIEITIKVFIHFSKQQLPYAIFPARKICKGIIVI